MLALRDRLHGALAHEVGEFIDMHSLLLDDPELLHGTEDLIRTALYGANYALRLQRDRLAAVFAGLDDAYFRHSIDEIAHASSAARRVGNESEVLLGLGVNLSIK